MTLNKISWYYIIRVDNRQGTQFSVLIYLSKHDNEGIEDDHDGVDLCNESSYLCDLVIASKIESLEVNDM